MALSPCVSGTRRWARLSTRLAGTSHSTCVSGARRTLGSGATPARSRGVRPRTIQVSLGTQPTLPDPTAKSHTQCHAVCTRDLRIVCRHVGVNEIDYRRRHGYPARVQRQAVRLERCAPALSAVPHDPCCAVSCGPVCLVMVSAFASFRTDRGAGLRRLGHARKPRTIIIPGDLSRTMMVRTGDGQRSAGRARQRPGGLDDPLRVDH